MRAAFLQELHRLAGQDDRVVLLTGDLGFTVVEPFARSYPSRFVNMGVAEANMIGVATGLAAQGFVPFCYSIATFASMRGYEQIRNGPVLHELPVRVVGIGGGFSYGSSGITHFALEDIGIARLQPNLAVVAPADDGQAAAALRATMSLPGPVYFRIGKDRASIAGLDGRFRLGRLERVPLSRDATGDGAPGPVDVLVLSYGGIAAAAVQAAEILTSRGVAVRAAVAACLNPAPTEDVREMAAEARLVVTVEDHYVTGGLGSLVAEVIAGGGIRTPLLRLGVVQPPRGRSGSEPYLRAQAGLSVEQVVESVWSAVTAHAPHASFGQPTRVG